MKTGTPIAAIAAFALMANGAFAITKTVNGIQWTYCIEDGKAIIGDYSSGETAVPQTTTGAIAIPSTLDECPVIAIGENAFDNCDKLTSVTIPNGVTSIGYSAFSNCEALKAVDIPDSVTEIGDSAFRYCAALETVRIGDGVTTIPYRCFERGESLKSLTIGSGVETIEDSAFADCPALGSATIPTNVTDIGRLAFCGDTSIATVVFGEGLRTVGDSAFRECLSLDGIALPSTLETIGDSAFFKCEALKVVDIPDSVTEIGDSAFRYCAALETVRIGDGVATISYQCFEHGESLKSLTIGSGVEKMEDSAFGSCEALSMVTLLGGVFDGYGEMPWESINLVLCSSAYAGAWKPILRQCGVEEMVELPDAEIQEETVEGKTWRFYIADGGAVICSGGWGESVSPLTNGEVLALPAILGGCTVTKIGVAAFAGMHEIAEISIPKTVTDIADFAFYECLGLTLVTFVEPSSLKSIGEAAFRWCVGLEGNFKPPSSSPTIGKNALQFSRPSRSKGMSADH